MRDYVLVNTTDDLYPRLTTIRYPKVGQVNPSSRVGVVPAQGGETRWMDVPGDPRDHYIARMDWAGRLRRAGRSSTSTGSRIATR